MTVISTFASEFVHCRDCKRGVWQLFEHVVRGKGTRDVDMLLAPHCRVFGSNWMPAHHFFSGVIVNDWSADGLYGMELMRPLIEAKLCPGHSVSFAVIAAARDWRGLSPADAEAVKALGSSATVTYRNANQSVGVRKDAGGGTTQS